MRHIETWTEVYEDLNNETLIIVPITLLSGTTCSGENQQTKNVNTFQAAIDHRCPTLIFHRLEVERVWKSTYHVIEAALFRTMLWTGL